MSSSLERKCQKDDKEYNPFTRRCNKKCKTEQDRLVDKKFKCLKKCESGFVRSSTSRRCVTKKKTRPRVNLSKNIADVLQNLDKENEPSEEDVQTFLYEFSELVKLKFSRKNAQQEKQVQKIKAQIDSFDFEDDVKNELVSILDKYEVP